MGALAVALLAATCAASPLAAQTVAGAEQTGTGSAFELTFWQSVMGSGDCAQYQAYLDAYPAGTFGALARAKMAQVAGCGAQARPTAAPQLAVAQPPAPVPAVIAAAPAPAAPTMVAVTASPMQPAAASLAERLTKASQTVLGGQAEAPALPPAPAFAAVSAPVPPARFCSAEDRNAFHDRRFVPAQRQAMENNRLAVAHMQDLRRFYDAVAANHDLPAMNASAQAAIAFDPVARRYFDDSARYQALFQQIMTAPVGDCDKAERQAQEDGAKDKAHA